MLSLEIRWCESSNFALLFLVILFPLLFYVILERACGLLQSYAEIVLTLLINLG